MENKIKFNGLTDEQSHRLIERVQSFALNIKIIKDSISLLEEQINNFFHDLAGMRRGNSHK